MKRLALGLAAALLAFGVAAAADEKASPTGTWKWSAGEGDQKREVTLKLKLDGDKLTGAILNRNGGETAIEEGAFKDGQVTFKVTRERNGNKVVSKYTAKLADNALKGKVEIDRNGEAVSRDFEAKRSAE